LPEEDEPTKKVFAPKIMIAMAIRPVFLLNICE